MMTVNISSDIYLNIVLRDLRRSSVSPAWVDIPFFRVDNCGRELIQLRGQWKLSVILSV